MADFKEAVNTTDKFLPDGSANPNFVDGGNRTANDTGKNIEIKGVTDKPLAGISLSEEALKVKEILSKEQKVMFSIPLDPGEKKGAYRSVTINGYRCEVKKGVMVALPMSIVSLLMDSMQMESAALNDNENNLANVDERTREALNA